MSFNWIEGKSYSINTLLLMDRYIIKVIADSRHPEFIKILAVTLANNPSILWYFMNKCPERSDYFNEIVKGVDSNLEDKYICECEIDLLEALDWAIVYMYPEVMEKLNYIADWDEDRILSMYDFKNKKVLDIGSGTGRLAFAVAPYAKWVYACEPVNRLRHFMRDKAKISGYENIYIVDGSIEGLPFPDDTFDVIVSGHVIGDDVNAEYKEMCRVLKHGGYIIDCPGEDDRKRPNGPSKQLLRLGFEHSHYISKSGGDVYRYWKQINK